MKTMLLTDELIASIAAKHHGNCGDTWYITSDEGVLYLHVRNKDHFLHPILMNTVIMRHLGYLPKLEPKQQPEPMQSNEVPAVTLDEMKEQINAYFNTHSAKERDKMFSLCHYPTSSVNDLHSDDATKLFNIIKHKLYGKH